MLEFQSVTVLLYRSAFTDKTEIVYDFTNKKSIAGNFPEDYIPSDDDSEIEDIEEFAFNLPESNNLFSLGDGILWKDVYYLNSNQL